jgi:hypothetical protein
MTTGGGKLPGEDIASYSNRNSIRNDHRRRQGSQDRIVLHISSWGCSFRRRQSWRRQRSTLPRRNSEVAPRE